MSVTAACRALQPSDRKADPRAALGRLHELLVKPLALKKGVKRVLISPEGPLCYVPFSALFDQAVALTPSGTTHVMFCAGSLMSQVLQCTQFCALIWKRAAPFSSTTS